MHWQLVPFNSLMARVPLGVNPSLCISHGGLRHFHQKSTCLHIINFRALCGDVTPQTWQFVPFNSLMSRVPPGVNPDACFATAALMEVISPSGCEATWQRQFKLPWRKACLLKSSR